MTTLVTLFGIVLTAGVSLTGLALTHHANRRLAQEQEQERERLRLDAAMRAGSLLHRTGCVGLLLSGTGLSVL